MELNWDAIGAVGELLGALVVIFTLVYLSRQIRQNSAALDRSNDYAQARSIHDSDALQMQVYSLLVQDAGLAAIYARALAGDSLDDGETVRMRFFVASYLLWFEDLFYQQETQLGFAATVGDTDLLVRTLGPYIRQLLDLPVVRPWWEEESRYHLSPPLHELIDRVIVRDEPLEQVRAEQQERGDA